MYESFFGFKERPFTLTPNTKYLFLSEHHESVIRMLLYGIEQRVVIMVLSGEVGSGNTTTIRALLNLIQDSVETSLILNPLLSTKDLVMSRCYFPNFEF
jgi:general secretion pathway protein A